MAAVAAALTVEAIVIVADMTAIIVALTTVGSTMIAMDAMTAAMAAAIIAARHHQVALGSARTPQAMGVNVLHHLTATGSVGRPTGAMSAVGVTTAIDGAVSS